MLIHQDGLIAKQADIVPAETDRAQIVIRSLQGFERIKHANCFWNVDDSRFAFFQRVHFKRLSCGSIGVRFDCGVEPDLKRRCPYVRA